MNTPSNVSKSCSLKSNDNNISSDTSVYAQNGGDMTENKLLSQMESIASWDDLAFFVLDLLEDHEENPDQWNNYHTCPFLDAMAHCIFERDERYENYDKPIPENQPWKIFAEILYAAKVYE